MPQSIPPRPLDIDPEPLARVQQAIDDIIIGLFTGWVTIYPQTVKVTK